MSRPESAEIAPIPGGDMEQSPSLGFDCGHSCCDERGDPFHDHLPPGECPACAALLERHAAVNAVVAGLSRRTFMRGAR